MALSFKLALKGSDDLNANLREIERDAKDKIVLNALDEGAKLTQDRASRLAPKGESRKLSNAIKRKKLDRAVIVYADRFTAFWIEYGTDPHEIKPKSKQALTIEGGVFARAKHPGARAKPFMRPALDETKNGVVRIMAREMEKDIKQLRLKR